MTGESQVGEGWLDAHSASALRATVPYVVAPSAVAIYARWWQFETWLRELVYVELRAESGTSWADEVASARQERDASSLRYMPTSDSENPLAYRDFTKLLELIGAKWSLFAPSLIDEDAWKGRIVELQKVRHRIMHLRRAHADDLGRLEQMLRDLESGALVALQAYNQRKIPDRSQYSDPVTTEWLDKDGASVSLIRHAEAVYGATVVIDASRRPWLKSWPNELDHATGVLWHFSVMFRDRRGDPRDLWRELVDPKFRDLLVHLLFHDPFHVEFTFAAVDDGTSVARAMDYAFRAALRAFHYAEDVRKMDYETSRRQASTLDHRVLSGTAWNIVDDDFFGTIFNAGA